jgi:hypothetical protein
MKNIVIAVVVTAIVAGGAGYWYGGNRAQASASALRAGRFLQSGQGTDGGNPARAGFGGAVNGDVLSVDAQGFTVSIQGGGSKVVIVPASATVMKSATGSLSDVSVGTHVTVIGSTNSDGSVTAQTIQIRADIPFPSVTP